jgi:hypothetical protein
MHPTEGLPVRKIAKTSCHDEFNRSLDISLVTVQP